MQLALAEGMTRYAEAQLHSSSRGTLLCLHELTADPFLAIHKDCRVCCSECISCNGHQYAHAVCRHLYVVPGKITIKTTTLQDCHDAANAG